MNEFAARRASDLRADFDRTFAEAPQIGEKGEHSFLAITLGEGLFALELSEVAGIYSNKKIVRIPSVAAGLLGIAGFRGTILPVYDLAALIGVAPLEAPRWMAVAAKVGIAVAFSAFEGHLRVTPNEIALNESKEGGREYIARLLRTPEGIRGVISLASALANITRTEIQLGS